MFFACNFRIKAFICANLLELGQRTFLCATSRRIVHHIYVYIDYTHVFILLIANNAKLENPFSSSPHALFNGLLWYDVCIAHSVYNIKNFISKNPIISCNMSVGKWDIISTYIRIAFAWCIKPLLSPHLSLLLLSFLYYFADVCRDFFLFLMINESLWNIHTYL